MSSRSSRRVAVWTATVSAVAIGNARSVIVHEPGSGARIACADLQ